MIKIECIKVKEHVNTVTIGATCSIIRNGLRIGSVDVVSDVSLTTHHHLMKWYKPVEFVFPKKMNKKYSEYLNDHPHIRTNLKGLKEELRDYFRCARKETIDEIVKTVKEQLGHPINIFDAVHLESANYEFDEIFNDIICAEEFYRFLHKNS